MATTIKTAFILQERTQDVGESNADFISRLSLLPRQMFSLNSVLHRVNDAGNDYDRYEGTSAINPWEADVEYLQGQTVRIEGSIFASVSDGNIGNTPTIDSDSYWIALGDIDAINNLSIRVDVLEANPLDSEWVVNHVSATVADSDYIHSLIDSLPDSDYIHRQIDQLPDSDYIQTQIDQLPDSDYIQTQIDSLPDSDWVISRLAELDSDEINNIITDRIRNIPNDSEWVIMTINSLSNPQVDSDWVLNQIPSNHLDSDYVLSVSNPQVDSDWVLNQIPSNIVDSDYVLGVSNPQVDSEWVTGLLPDHFLDSEDAARLTNTQLSSRRLVTYTDNANTYTLDTPATALTQVGSHFQYNQVSYEAELSIYGNTNPRHTFALLTTTIAVGSNTTRGDKFTITTTSTAPTDTSNGILTLTHFDTRAYHEGDGQPDFHFAEFHFDDSDALDTLLRGNYTPTSELHNHFYFYIDRDNANQDFYLWRVTSDHDVDIEAGAITLRVDLTNNQVDVRRGNTTDFSLASSTAVSGTIPGHSGTAADGNTTSVSDGQAFFKTSSDSETWRVTDSESAGARSGTWNALQDGGTSQESAYHAPGNTTVSITVDGTSYSDADSDVDYAVGIQPVGGGTRLTYAEARAAFNLPANATNELNRDGILNNNGDLIYVRFNTTDTDGFLLIGLGDRDAPNAGQAVMLLSDPGTAGSSTLPTTGNQAITTETQIGPVIPVDQTLSGTGVFQYNSGVGDNGNWSVGTPTVS